MSRRMFIVVAALFALTACAPTGAKPAYMPGSAQDNAVTQPVAPPTDEPTLETDLPPLEVNWPLMGYLFVFVTEAAFIRVGPTAQGKWHGRTNFAIVGDVVTAVLIAIMQGMGAPDVFVCVVAGLLAIAALSKTNAAKPAATTTEVKA